MEKILFVEDDELIGECVCMILAGKGYAIDWRKDGIDGEQAIKTGSYQLILLDATLPGISGLALLQGARQRGITTPIIIATAQLSTDNRLKFLNAGADDFIAKPFDFDNLLKQIQLFTTEKA